MKLLSNFSGAVPPVGDAILLENGDYLLQENTSYILLE